MPSDKIIHAHDTLCRLYGQTPGVRGIGYEEDSQGQGVLKINVEKSYLAQLTQTLPKDVEGFPVKLRVFRRLAVF